MEEMSDKIKCEIARMSEGMRRADALVKNSASDKSVRTEAHIEMLMGTARNLMLSDCDEKFLCNLPHDMIEEYELHAVLLSNLDDFDKLMEHINELIRYTKEWEVFKLLMPAFATKKNMDKLFPYIMKWLKSGNDGAVCLAIRLLRHKYIKNARIWPAIDAVLLTNDSQPCVRNEKASFLAEVYVEFGRLEVDFLESGELDRDLQLRVIRKVKRKNSLTQEQRNYVDYLLKLEEWR